MFTLNALLTLVDGYCEATGLAEATLSSRLFNDGKRLTEVRHGADIGIRRLERALVWLSRHWPVGAEWPNDVPRPVVPVEAAE